MRALQLSVQDVACLPKQDRQAQVALFRGASGTRGRDPSERLPDRRSKISSIVRRPSSATTRRAVSMTWIYQHRYVTVKVHIWARCAMPHQRTGWGKLRRRPHNPIDSCTNRAGACVAGWHLAMPSAPGPSRFAQRRRRSQALPGDLAVRAPGPMVNRGLHRSGV
jgi:hypothetical protein